MIEITLRDIALVDDDAAILTLDFPAFATLRGLLLLRMLRSFLRTLMCRYFLMAGLGTVPCLNSTRLAAALTIRASLEMNDAEPCARYNLPTALVKP